MDQDTLRHAHKVLQSMINDRRLRVGFLLDQHGRLITHTGTATSFHPHGKFGEWKESQQDEGENVFMTGLAEHFILGAVFDDDLSVEIVREIIAPSQKQLLKILAPYFPKRKR